MIRANLVYSPNPLKESKRINTPPCIPEKEKNFLKENNLSCWPKKNPYNFCTLNALYALNVSAKLFLHKFFNIA